MSFILDKCYKSTKLATIAFKSLQFLTYLCETGISIMYVIKRKQNS